MTPNQVTALRVLLAFAAVAFFGRPAVDDVRSMWLGALAVGLVVAAVSLDAVDGYLARRKNLATPLGAQLDILGDRVIENLFFTYFAVCGLITLWVPVVFFVRGALTDFFRSMARARVADEPESFRRNWMLESHWGRAVVASRLSRAAYGVMKCVCFCTLGLQWTLLRSSAFAAGKVATPITSALHAGAVILVGATVAFCVLRAAPVVWEGRRYLTEPKTNIRRTAVGTAQ